MRLYITPDAGDVPSSPTQFSVALARAAARHAARGAVVNWAGSAAGLAPAYSVATDLFAKPDIPVVALRGGRARRTR